MSLVVRLHRIIVSKAGPSCYLLSIFILFFCASCIYREVPLSTRTVPASSESVIQQIRDHHLTPPSKEPYPVEQFGSYANGYSMYIEKLFRKKGTNYKGVFVEAGAYDGITASNSIYLEKASGWSGILIECNPFLLPKLRTSNRKAWIADVCLSPHSTPMKTEFNTLSEWPASAKIGDPLSPEQMKVHGIDWVKNKTWISYEMTCFPLYSILRAVGEWSSLDFLSLDVEGAEIEILRNFPFDLFPIKVLIVEVHTYTADQKKELRNLMSEKGYLVREKWELDDVYVHRSQRDLLDH